MTDKHTRLDPASHGARGAQLSAVIGAGLFVGGVYSLFATDAPAALGITLLLAAFFDGLLALFTIKRSRMAWAFLLVQNAVLSFSFLVAAPKLRDIFEIHVLLALLPCVAHAAATTLLAVSRDEFR